MQNRKRLESGATSNPARAQVDSFTTPPQDSATKDSDATPPLTTHSSPTGRAMGKETSIGLAVIAELLGRFGYVIDNRMKNAEEEALANETKAAKTSPTKPGGEKKPSISSIIDAQEATQPPNASFATDRGQWSSQADPRYQSSSA